MVAGDPLFIYYTKDAQLYHKYLVTEFYLKLLEGPGKIQEFENHYSIGEIRPDAYCVYQIEKPKSIYLMFIEVQIPANPLNIKKYETLFDSGVWEDNEPNLPFSRIIVITDRNYRINSKLKFITIKTDFSDWMKVFD